MDESEFEYRLVGIVDHMGSADAGHYLSYINVENDKIFKPAKQEEDGVVPFADGDGDTWLEFNDHQIKSFDTKDFESLCYGGDSNQSAYMRFHEKIKKKKMKVVLPSELFSD